jgi:hypothetical protein
MHHLASEFLYAHRGKRCSLYGPPRLNRRRQLLQIPSSTGMGYWVMGS